MKKKWMKLTAIVCVLTLLLGMTPASFAAEAVTDQAGDSSAMMIQSDSTGEADDQKTDPKVREDRLDETEEDRGEDTEQAEVKENTPEEADQETEEDVQDEKENNTETKEADDRQNLIDEKKEDQAAEEEADAFDQEQPETEEISIPDAQEPAGDEREAVFEAASAGEITFTLAQNSYTYTGSQIQPQIKNVMAIVDGKQVSLNTNEYFVAYDNNENVGNSAIISVIGKGSKYQNYLGSKNFTITPASIGAPCQLSLTQTSFVFNGSAIAPAVSGVYNGYNLVLNKDFKVSYYNNVNAGTATVAVQGAGNFTGNVNMYFTIAKAPQALQATASPAKVKLKKTARIKVTGYKGTLTFKSSKPSVASVSAKGIVKAKKTGTVTITVTAAATGNYEQAVARLKVTVAGKELKKNNTKVKLSRMSYTYDGKKKKPSVKVTYKGKKLKRNRDYKVTYKNNIDAGKATVAITGINKYSGTIKKTFKIKKTKNTLKATINKTSIDIKKTAKIKVKNAAGELTFASDDTYVATVSSTGLVTGKHTGSCTITVTAAGDVNHKKMVKEFDVYVGIRELSDSACTVILSDDEYVYDGTSKRPGVTVKYDGLKLKKDRDYSVTYYDNQNAGEAKVYLKGKGNYRGSVTETFTIKKANQKNFKVSLANNHIPLGGKARVIAQNARGGLSYGSYSPSYAKPIGNGWFQGLKKTENYVTITITSIGDENYKSKTIEMRVQIY